MTLKLSTRGHTTYSANFLSIRPSNNRLAVVSKIRESKRYYSIQEITNPNKANLAKKQVKIAPRRSRTFKSFDNVYIHPPCQLS